MRIGVFADAHDHVDNIRQAVDIFNSRGCETVIFAADLVSTIAVPPLRKLRCPFVGCFGDNEGNRLGIYSGMAVVGSMAPAPIGVQTADGTRILLTHQKELLRGQLDGCDVVIFGHTHRSSIHRDEDDRLHLNPGETGGWSYRRPSVAILETRPLEAKLVYLSNGREA